MNVVVVNNEYECIRNIKWCVFILQEAAQRRQRQADGLPNILEIEGVARPNPRPQVEISVSQQGTRRAVPTNNRGAVPVHNPRRPNARPPRYRYNVRRMFEERGAHNESDIEVKKIHACYVSSKCMLN